MSKKTILAYSTNEITAVGVEFRKALGLDSANTKAQREYCPQTCAFKVGSESIYSLDVLSSLKSIGIAPATIRIKGQEKPSARTDAERNRNLYTTTGAYEAKLIPTVNGEGDKKKYHSLSLENCLKIVNIFLDMDFKDTKLEQYREGIKNPTNVSPEVKAWIEEEVKFLEDKAYFGQRPNAITLSKSGLHFHYQLDLSSGWSKKGIAYLQDLPKCDLGLDIKCLEDQVDQIHAWIKTMFDAGLKSRGYDEAVIDAGSRKTREQGMWHTKDLTNPFLLMPYTGTALSTTLLNVKTDYKAKEKAQKKEIDEIKKEIESPTKNTVFEYLTGDEIITIGTSGKKHEVSDAREITVRQLQDNFDEIYAQYGQKQELIHICADWLSSRVEKPYQSIGGAFAYMGKDGAIFVIIKHPMKPKNDQGKEVKMFILPTPVFTIKMARKTQAKALNLSLDKHGKPEKTENNLRLILEHDQFVGDFYKYDILRHEPCIHQSIAADGWYHGSAYSLQDLEKSLRAKAHNKPFSQMEAGLFTDMDARLLQHYIKEKYDVEFKTEFIYSNLAVCLMARDLVYNTVAEAYQHRHKEWVKAGKPEVLDTWLPEALNVDRFLNPTYYAHLQMVGRKVLLGMTARAFSSHDPTKVELMLAITGKAQGTGKSTLANVLLNSIFGISFSKSETTESKILTNRFMLSTKADGEKAGDQVQRFAGKLVYLLEEFGSEQVGKKSANELKTAISESTIEGRKAYGKDSTKLNLTHFIISTTNDKKILHHGDGDQRRFLILDLDYVGSDGYYACVLGGQKQKENDLVGNIGLIDNGKKMHDLLCLAWGEAYARTIKGEITHHINPSLIAQKNKKDAVTGKPIEGDFVHCEMPRLTRKQINDMRLINETYEMRNDRVDDLLRDFFRRQGKSKVSYSMKEIETDLKETMGTLKGTQAIATSLQTLDVPLMKVKKASGNVWVMFDKSSGTYLTENPYAKIDDEKDISASQVLASEQDKNQEIARLYAQLEQARLAQAQAEIAAQQAQAQMREAQLRASQAMQQAKELEAKKQDIVVVQATPVEYGFTPELDDDDDREIEIVVAQSPKVPNHPLAKELAKAVNQKIEAKTETKIETKRDIKAPFSNPLKKLDPANLPKSIMDNITRKPPAQ